MASLVDELVDVLNAEKQMYEALISYGENKRDVLISADISALEQITAGEQLTSDELMSLSNRQVRLLKDIATVLGQAGEQMTVTQLIESLGSQPDAQQKLTVARDSLIAAAAEMKHLNDENMVLLQQAIELNEFDITLFKSLRQAPETANYNRSACNTGSRLGGSGFDASS